MQNLMILCPLKAELSSLLTCLEEHYSYTIEKAKNLNVYCFAELNLKLAQGGHGKTQFALQTTYLLTKYPQTQAVFCMGCAGAIAKPLEIFDIVLAKKTCEHDYQIKFYQRPMPEFKGDTDLLSQFEVLKFDHVPVHFVSIASGDEDIVQIERAQELAKKTKCQAVAWEGAGGARACKFHKIPFVEIRAITDKANQKTQVDFEKNLNICMQNLAKFLIHFLKQNAKSKI